MIWAAMPRPNNRPRPEDRQVAPGLTQAPPGGGQNGVIQGAGHKVLEGSMQRHPPRQGLEGPGGPAEDRGRIMVQAERIQADLGIEAQFQKKFQITPL